LTFLCPPVVMLAAIFILRRYPVTRQNLHMFFAAAVCSTLFCALATDADIEKASVRVRPSVTRRMEISSQSGRQVPYR
jgi:hypothetical protein